MYYVVRAKFNYDKASDFLRKLRDGSIANQKPDGVEIINAMKRAVVDEDGYVHWSERCFNPSPLEHQRATVYDHYFSEIETEQVNTYIDFEGPTFMNQLIESSRQTA